jgi:ABC-2 type transport system ATP-binding protein
MSGVPDAPGAEDETGRVLIAVRGVTKEFVLDWRGTARVALAGVDLKVARGRVCALVGPNGSGKTTLLKILAGVVRPTRGHVAIDASVRGIGFVPDELQPPDGFRVEEWLGHLARVQGTAAQAVAAVVDSALGAAGIVTQRRHRIGELSKGLRQRLGLAQALLGEPALLLLDEPAAALDPRALEQFADLIEAQRAAGRTIVLSSHFLPQVERIADDFVLLEQGRVIFAGDRAAVAARGGLDAVYLAEVRG